MLRDPSSFTWHPLYLVVSLLAGTPFHNAIVDVDAFVLFMLTTAGFVTLAHYLTAEMALTISDGWIIFYALSFTYSVIALTTGASWLTFLGNQSALLLARAGHPAKIGTLRGVAELSHALHPCIKRWEDIFLPPSRAPYFCRFFAVWACKHQPSTVLAATGELADWLCPGGISADSPGAHPSGAARFFRRATASHGVIARRHAGQQHPGFMDFPTSNLSPAWRSGWLPFSGQHPYTTYTLALGSSAAAVWCLVPALLINRTKWRGLEVVTLALMIFMVTVHDLPSSS